MKILKNYTRYNTEDLCALMDYVVNLPTTHPGLFVNQGSPNWRMRDRGPDYEMDVDYWTGDIHQARGRWRDRTNGPWYCPEAHTKAEKLLILHPNKVLETLSPAEALATAGDVPVLPEVALRHISLVLMQWAHVMHVPRQADTMIPLGDFRIRIEKNQQAHRKALPPEEKRARLKEIFLNGQSARTLGDSLYEIQGALRRYEVAHAKTEVQRKRFLAKGGQAEPHPTPTELLAKLLADSKRGS
jgi:hypothetical protein